MKQILKILGIVAGSLGVTGMFLLPTAHSEPKAGKGKVEKVAIIHKPGEKAEKILFVPTRAVAGHERHGDTRPGGKTR